MGRYSFPLHGDLQSQASSEIRLWPDDDGDDDDASSEDGVDLGSQKECSPR